MSSIYRKGRDGYFYYQTYSINSETGKKDKKIFHSLGTKDRTEAEKQKVILDFKYARKQSKKTLFKFLPKKYRNVAIVAITILITLFISEKVPNNNSQDSKNIIMNDAVEHKYFKNQELNQIIDTSIGVADTTISNTRLSTSQTESKKIEKVLTENVIIPDYKIERVERLSDLFDQGKLFLTVKDNSNIDALRKVCEEVAKEYNEFSNIVICLYTDNDIGRELALGIDNQISKQEYIKAWLAMYTYNPVEGAYFDENPGDYLGAF